ncbi:MAG: ribosome silencing factor [Simkania negevensis]|nr:ribosome silencing factor [Simkania negevensis]
MARDPSEFIHHIAQVIFDKKGSNILAMDVRKISSMTDYVIIANGNINRHVIALAKVIQDECSKEGLPAAYFEGMQHGDWIVLDYFYIMIHLFVPDMRQKYQLERLWSHGKIIDLNFLEEKSKTKLEVGIDGDG